MTFDFDRISEWGPRLTAALDQIVPAALRNGMAHETVELVEDAFDLVMAGADAIRLIDATRQWLRQQSIIGYHGSRLSEAEIDSVRSRGLQPLIPWMRQARLEAMLSRHPRWAEVRDRFEKTMAELADGALGRREGQAHLTISRGALLTAFNHYLVEGSEFDQAVAVELLGEQAHELLQVGRSPVLFAVGVPGARALEVSERYTHPGEMSGLVRRVLQFWAYWLHDPAFDPATQHLDFGLVFYEPIPPEWVIDVAIVEESELRRFYDR